MSTHRSGHALVIALDQGMVRRAHEDGDTVDPLDRELWEWTIRCERTPDDFDRECVTWWECGCTPTVEQREAMFRDGDEGPCPQSPTGFHRERVGELSPALPSTDCWARVCEAASDAVHDLADRRRLGPGEYRIFVHPDGGGIEFELDGA